MRRPGFELDLVPAERNELRDAKPVAVGEQDHGSITERVPTSLGGGDENLFDLVRRQVLTRSPGGIGESGRGRER